MRKETQQKIMVAFIVGTFVLSSIAFVTTGLFAGSDSQQNEEFKPLDTFVVEGELDSSMEYEYLRRGYTTLKFYSGSPPAFIDQLPDATRTGSGQVQLIVQKIISNEVYAIILGPYGEKKLDSLDENGIFAGLCGSLLVTPIECGLANPTVP